MATERRRTRCWTMRGTIAATALIVVLMKSFAFASNYIPSESMVPTLEIGDRLFVERWPYGISRYSLAIDPGFSLAGGDGRLFSHTPRRGDVVTFAHPVTHETMVKRVIGLPGDRIAMHQVRLFINGQEVPRRKVATYDYRAPSGYVVQVSRAMSRRCRAACSTPSSSAATTIPADNFAEVTVPAGELFMMGDNRDDSADSRFAEMGFVPLENLEGRVGYDRVVALLLRPRARARLRPQALLTPKWSDDRAAATRRRTARGGSAVERGQLAVDLVVRRRGAQPRDRGRVEAAKAVALDQFADRHALAGKGRRA